MIGLGVGIDYALFVVTRTVVPARGPSGRRVRSALANATAGSAVLFAGITVVIAIARPAARRHPVDRRRWARPRPSRSRVAMLAAVTLLPAFLGLAGRASTVAHRPHVRRSRRPHQTLAGRWAVTSAATRGATRSAASSSSPALAAPGARHAHRAAPTTAPAATGTTYRRAYDLVATGFGPGVNGPLIVVVDGRPAAPPPSTERRVAPRLPRPAWPRSPPARSSTPPATPP